ncbi:fungal-specific transcription factor domain-containing protein [Aspergillus pseudoustus]|uniref:Fungal-specific transcription factor domain-containing protein n=1 Tax=Aspergillus pseudoustus TaxID=1810923 RepID=A0ABR4K5K6_9EURO
MSSGRRTPRASIACTKCRSRKVRCDVAHRGHPCMNCKLDQEECVVQLRGRQSRLRLEPSVLDGGEVQPSSNAPQAQVKTAPPAKPRTVRRTPKPKPKAKLADPASASASPPTDIAFQAYPFIRSDFLSRLDQDEICYLDSQSCFRLPVAAPWQAMLQAYFAHINPLIPVLDEAGFWRTVRDDGISSTRISLFVVQAILFAACPFASRRTIRECGFTNCRKARAAFYRRAKLLYRLESELRPVEIIQGSLLLSLCSSAQTESPVNSVWLSIAVQHARTLGVHQHQATSLPQGALLAPDWLEIRRLWWVCLVRDRIIALAHRRPLQIAVAPESWDAELELLSSSQVCEATCRSEVHSAGVRRGLFAVFVSVIRLCVPLTRILTLNNTDIDLNQAETCVETLCRWHEETEARFEACYCAGTPRDSLAMHELLLEIYYHSAHLHVLNSKTKAAVSLHQRHTPRVNVHTLLVRTGTAVQTVIEAIAACLSTLAQRQLAQYLPTSIIMCAVPSVVLDAVYLKTAAQAQSQEQGNSTSQAAATAARNRIQIFYETSLALKTRYNNVHPATDVITKVVDLLDGPAAMDSTPESAQVQVPRFWMDLIASQPRFYLAVLDALDSALSTGKIKVSAAGSCLAQTRSSSTPADGALLYSVSNVQRVGSGVDLRAEVGVDVQSTALKLCRQISPPAAPPLPIPTEPQTAMGDGDFACCDWASSSVDADDFLCKDGIILIPEENSPRAADHNEQMVLQEEDKPNELENTTNTYIELGAQMADSRPENPFLRDIFGLCRDLDFEALLGMV